MAVHFLFTTVTAGSEVVKTSGEEVLFTEVRFEDSGFYVGLKAPSLAGSQSYSLPASDGSNNQVLTTDGSGVLSWSTKGGGAGATEAFKTFVPVTGTNVVADAAADTLTFLVGSNKVTILGDGAADSLTVDIVEGNIDHDALTNFVANEHIAWTAASDNLVTSGSILSSGVGGLTTGSNANTGKVVIYDGSSHTITITAPSIAASYTLTLPTTDGDADQLLKTDGSGNLGWVTSVATDVLVKVDAGGTADYLNASYFERDAGNHIRIKQNSLLTGVSAEKWAGQGLPADPGADRILFWDESAPDEVAWLTVGAGLTLAGTTLSASGASSQVPIGAITAWVGGYFTNGANGGYTAVLAANNVAAANAYLQNFGFWVCDGAAVNDAASPIWVGANRYLPKLTDDIFLQGDTIIGGLGGENANSHNHNVGTYATANESAHTHAKGTIATANESAHTHSNGSYATEGHAHTSFNFVADADGAHNHDDGTYSVASHLHTVDPPNTTSSQPSGLTSEGSGPVSAANQVHTHTVNIAQFNSGSTAPDVTGASGTEANHTHTVSGSSDNTIADITGTSSAGSAHSHSVTGTSSAGSAHKHTVSGSSANANDTENRPNFFGCLYIVKVKEI